MHDCLKLQSTLEAGMPHFFGNRHHVNRRTSFPPSHTELIFDITHICIYIYRYKNNLMDGLIVHDNMHC